MRIICLSDTHSFNERVGVLAGDDPEPFGVIPDGDVLIHAGDLTDTGKPNEIFDAYAWLSKMPHERIIVTPGNHDFGFEKIPELRRVLDGKFKRVQTLIDEETMIGNMRVWGSPWQPWFHDWAYNFLPGPAGERQAKDKWDEIPDDTSILVVHGPAYNILDRTLRGRYVGCPALRQRIDQLDMLRLFVCGHVHEAHGTQLVGSVLHVNASICDQLYDPVQKPVVVDWDGEQFIAVESA